jgi:hypothetical protein
MSPVVAQLFLWDSNCLRTIQLPIPITDSPRIRRTPRPGSLTERVQQAATLVA